MNNLFHIAIIGRPNIGKSTFFNKLVGKKIAIIDDSPGITRDRKTSIGNIGPYEFTVTDTPGLEKKSSQSLSSRMNDQTQQAVEHADTVLFMVDGIAGITDEELYYAKWLRKFNKKTIVIINKSENIKKIENCFDDAYRLGFGEPICISAEHKLGFNDILEQIAEDIDNHRIEPEDKIEQIQISIIGRPNAGKSTLINTLINDNRLITGPEAGITRDSIEVNWTYGEYKIKLVDTAGIRKRAKVTNHIEKQSVEEAKRAIIFSQLVVVLIDATKKFEQQDLNIINYAVKEGRAVVLVINKWDLVTDIKEMNSDLDFIIKNKLSSLSGINITFISAKNKYNLDALMDNIIETYKKWNVRIPTAQVNNWITNITANQPIPMGSNSKRPRIKYATQIKSRPPTICLHANTPENIPKTYLKFLLNDFRRTFNLEGCNIRLITKKNNNPYTNNDKK